MVGKGEPPEIVHPDHLSHGKMLVLSHVTDDKPRLLTDCVLGRNLIQG